MDTLALNKSWIDYKINDKMYQCMCSLAHRDTGAEEITTLVDLKELSLKPYWFSDASRLGFSLASI